MSSDIAKGEHYNLRWNNFVNNLVQVLFELRHKELLVDVTLLCEGHQIKAHKIVLAACSDFFMDLFKNMEEAHPIITFYEIKYIHLKQIIQFIYQGEVKVQDVDLEGVLSLGEKFQVKGLSSVKLKHKVTPTGDDISDGSIKYSILSVKSFSTSEQKKEETNTTDAINSNTPKGNIPENTYNPIEPVKKKIKVNATKENLPQHLSKLEKLSTRTIEENLHTTVKRKTVISETQTDTPRALSCNEKSDKIVPINHSQSKSVSQPNSFNSEKTVSVIKENKSEQNTLNESSSDSTEKPVNAFIIFSKEWRKKLKVEHPEEDFKSISVRLGNLWKSLTSETRESYYMAARQAQLCFQNSKPEL